MSGNSAAETVALIGPCTMHNVSELLELAKGELARVLDAGSRPAAVRLDLSGVTELDACGCQLLAVLVDNLVRRGIATFPCGYSAEVGRSVEVLGFAEALGLKQGEGEAA
jgi:anti-anti-sigma regulatory factor